MSGVGEGGGAGTDSACGGGGTGYGSGTKSDVQPAAKQAHTIAADSVGPFDSLRVITVRKNHAKDIGPLVVTHSGAL